MLDEICDDPNEGSRDPLSPLWADLAGTRPPGISISQYHLIPLLGFFTGTGGKGLTLTVSNVADGGPHRKASSLVLVTVHSNLSSHHSFIVPPLLGP
jgi:hypothetical protein